jgi:hypothetical protein
MKRLTCAFALLLSLIYSNVEAQVQLNLGEQQFIFNSFSGTGAGTQYAVPGSGTVITWIVSYASAPASVTVNLECSNDNTTYVTCDSSTNVNGDARTLISAARFVRASVAAKSGGGNTTLTVIVKVANGFSPFPNQSTPPTCITNCGTNPTVTGSDRSMRVTMGATGTPATGFVIQFNGSIPFINVPACSVFPALAGMTVGKTAVTVVVTTSTITVETNGTNPSNNDRYTILCW